MLGPKIVPKISCYLSNRYLKRLWRDADRRRKLDNATFFSPVELRGDIHALKRAAPSTGETQPMESAAKVMADSAA